MTLPTGTRIGAYEIVGWLGAGGMGEVYRARDPRLGREVAIKLIADAFATDAGRLRRFEQEARAAGQLNHPNILSVYDVGSEAGAPFIVSEVLEGESLRRRMRGGALPPRKAIDYARQAAEGLAAAHDKGIVHRDMKPDNLFITNEGRVKILDFGIAKLRGPDDESARHPLGTETADGVVMGTAGYMSPEQVRGEPVDARSDIFSLGAILFEMLSGRPAFARENARGHDGGHPEGRFARSRNACRSGARADRLAVSGEIARVTVSVRTRSGVRPGRSVGNTDGHRAAPMQRFVLRGCASRWWRGRSPAHSHSRSRLCSCCGRRGEECLPLHRLFSARSRARTSQSPIPSAPRSDRR